MLPSVRLVSAGLALAGLALLPGSAPAGEGCDKGFDVVTHVFETSDRDGSGTLSPQEFEAGGLERYGMPFDAYDTDGDGEASRDEYLELYDRYHPADGVEGGIES